ncbi:hypothetical protein CC85DRAFT_190899 [Cutaneotrichosporon oleaginosum]|uniref:Uncharacterized protein n=1 Tax=Cutaneotrichosporon oleaginosum TaxID=879819 RepID=A0A0J0XV26_9TREE|nr:uncharacterized protein CC85DRAFT_190899 [Cutaneotrichosporon oleaginosum]KLT44916.1 hypothetical protein CC85DRAFT_190899 [Cutaneotrichosporon oleaginosum]TXT12044.1 hypothetical protein COLE_02454 [Cutaneotrichosporon oleaginosum]
MHTPLFRMFARSRDRTITHAPCMTLTLTCHCHATGTHVVWPKLNMVSADWRTGGLADRRVGGSAGPRTDPRKHRDCVKAAAWPADRRHFRAPSQLRGLHPLRPTTRTTRLQQCAPQPIPTTTAIPDLVREKSLRFCPVLSCLVRSA